MIVDLHSHILPKMDDGSASIAESLELLRMQWEQGIHTVVATPHFYAHRDQPEAFLQRRNASFAQLEEAMQDQAQMPRIYLGAEVYYFQGMSDSEKLQQLTIGDSPYILVEMPMVRWTDRMYDELQQISYKQGLTPIVAHVDRYFSPFSSHRIPQRLEELPVLVQANASFFLEKASRRKAIKMLKRNQIQLLGSDCHNTQTRRPNLGYAVNVIGRELGQDALESIAACQKQVLNYV